MRRPSPAVLGSVALHLGVAALAFLSWPERSPEDPKPLVSSVPVSIVSETEVAAAAADNPQPEPSLENAATAPVQQPDPVPPTPEPTPMAMAQTVRFRLMPSEGGGGGGAAPGEPSRRATAACRSSAKLSSRPVNLPASMENLL